jgi:hypothetical protein
MKNIKILEILRNKNPEFMTKNDKRKFHIHFLEKQLNKLLNSY